MNEHDAKEHFVEVAIHTTSGTNPDDGYIRFNQNQPVRHALKEAEKRYNITDTSNWVALRNEAELNPDGSYVDQELSGQLDIDWGPREGGGGCTN